MVDAVEPFQVRVQTIEKQGVEHVAGDLAWRGIGGGLAWPAVGGSVARPHPHDEQPVGAQVQGRAERCRLAHGAVAEVLVAHARGGEDHGNGRGGHQVVDTDLGRYPAAPGPLPWDQSLDTLEEGHRTTAGIARSGHGQRPQTAGVDALLDAREAQVALHHLS